MGKKAKEVKMKEEEVEITLEDGKVLKIWLKAGKWSCGPGDFVV